MTFLLGFLLGLSVWTVCKGIIRLYRHLRLIAAERAYEQRMFNEYSRRLEEGEMGCLEIDFEYRGLKFKSSEIENGDSIVTISRDGREIKKFTWPTYKIFNIQAHAEDIFESLEDGLHNAGCTGFGGNVYKKEAP